MVNKTFNTFFAIVPLIFALAFAPCSTAQAAATLQDAPPATEQDPDKSKSDDQDEDKSKPEQDKDSVAPDKKADDKKADADKDDKAAARQKKRNARRRISSFEKNSSTSREFVSLFAPAVASVSSSTVVITDGRKQIGLGMIIDSDGLILTKASILKGKLTCKLADGTKIKAEVIGLDPKTDLALLKIDAENLTAARLELIELPTVGSWLATTGIEENALSVGVVGVNARVIKPSRALMGVYPVDLDPKLNKTGVRVNRVTPDSPAWRADILVNDVIIAIDDIDTPTSEKLFEIMGNFVPGDRVRVTLMRGEKKLIKTLTLSDGNTINPMMERSNQQNSMGSKLSRRRNDFPLAIQHDSVIQANQCGGPVVNLSGKIIGINIARSGRVSTLTLPVEILLPVIESLKSGQFAPGIVNKTKIKSINEELLRITKSLSDSAKMRNKLELEFRVEKAREEELSRILVQHKKRLAKLKKSREQAAEKLAVEKKKINKGDLRKERLEQDLKQLSSGIKK